MRRPLSELESKWINLAAEKLGTKVLFATDDFFAEKENLIKPKPAIFLPDEYTENGKWMDGWESRRKREPGHDYAIVKLGLPGTIQGFNIDTAFFTGNHPPAASVEACFAPGEENLSKLESGDWKELLKRSDLGPGQDNFFEVQSDGVYTHVRLRIYPDGGVARLRVYGRADREAVKSKSGEIDFACAVNGGLVLSCNDMYFSPKDNLIMPYKSGGMHDGWETRRRREPGHDWSIISFGKPGKLKRVELDTAFFKGNFPDSFSLEWAMLDNDAGIEAATWKPLLAQTKLQADHLHIFDGAALDYDGVVSHVRLNIFPDGGVARLRCYGVAD